MRLKRKEVARRGSQKGTRRKRRRSVGRSYDGRSFPGATCMTISPCCCAYGEDVFIWDFIISNVFLLVLLLFTLFLLLGLFLLLVLLLPEGQYCLHLSHCSSCSSSPLSPSLFSIEEVDHTRSLLLLVSVCGPPTW